MIILQIWLYCAVTLISAHLLSALLIDGEITLGTWGKTALVLFVLLGPLGVLLEACLLIQVFGDIRSLIAEQDSFLNFRRDRKRTAL